ncbi:lysozyme inhibitor LprI family protein [Pseudoduganella violacea]|uniref:Uncharacterized protein YecT (DUF1311 family) n=1 Tax=Pseudoduganella violacea TaxID=1715466 RepID=A0A7W5B6Z4_9BURK|nr:lysozyme inhibitor LprI family protein [Pseudoduganella violacea]MBB3117704.1 uncharacterized protein YecT (DUF1311 family) [Pseudoduganella violacea]
MRPENAIVVAMLGLAAAVSAFAQSTRDAELRSADKKLNEVYAKVSGRMEAGERAKLQKAQRVWLQFRDMDCKWAFPAEPVDCLVNRTNNRKKELEQSLFFDTQGKYTSLEIQD